MTTRRDLLFSFFSVGDVFPSRNNVPLVRVWWAVYVFLHMGIILRCGWPTLANLQAYQKKRRRCIGCVRSVQRGPEGPRVPPAWIYPSPMQPCLVLRQGHSRHTQTPLQRPWKYWRHVRRAPCTFRRSLSRFPVPICVSDYFLGPPCRRPIRKIPPPQIGIPLARTVSARTRSSRC